MLEESDFKKIAEEIGKVIEDNVNPQFEALRIDVAALKTDVSGMKAEMVTKSYLDDKLGKLRGDLIFIDRKEDEKINMLSGALHRKGVLGSSDFEQIQAIEVFPKPPVI